MWSTKLVVQNPSPIVLVALSTFGEQLPALVEGSPIQEPPRQRCVFPLGHLTETFTGHLGQALS